MFLSDNKITTANTYVILLLIHMNLSVLHVLAHLIFSAALQSITVIITPVLKRRKLSQRLVQWHA